MTDPIERLRDADPVPEPVSHPSEARVRATLQEILMTDTDVRADQPTTTHSRMRDPRVIGIAAALLLIAGVVGAVLASGGSSSEEPVASGATTLPAGDPGDGLSSGVNPGDGGTQATSCVETYDLDTLTHREYAFDGTVTSVDGQDMTFQVNEWFTGGDDDTVTLDHQGYAGMLFAPEGPALEPGTRVLVAGDGGFVWSCGFTQAYDQALAEQWRTALAG